MDAAVIERMEALASEGALNYASAEALADEFGVKPRSIVASATRRGLTYNKKPRVSKTGEKVTTKENLVGDIADKVGVTPDKLDGLDKASKSALRKLLDALGD